MKQYRMSEIVSEVSERVDDPSQSGYTRFVGLEHFDSGEVVISKFGDASKLISSMKTFRSGDILIARRNVYLRRAATVDFDGITSGDSIVLRASDPVIARLLPFVLNTDDFWDFANRHSDGTMSKRLSPKTLMEYTFTLPETDEQPRFAELLWGAYRAKQAYQKLIIATDDLVKSQFIALIDDEIKPLPNSKDWRWAA